MSRRLPRKHLMPLIMYAKSSQQALKEFGGRLGRRTNLSSTLYDVQFSQAFRDSSVIKLF
jgi:hypothetical protein